MYISFKGTRPARAFSAIALHPKIGSLHSIQQPNMVSQRTRNWFSSGAVCDIPAWARPFPSRNDASPIYAAGALQPRDEQRRGSCPPLPTQARNLPATTTTRGLAAFHSHQRTPQLPLSRNASAEVTLRGIQTGCSYTTAISGNEFSDFFPL